MRIGARDEALRGHTEISLSLSSGSEMTLALDQQFQILKKGIREERIPALVIPLPLPLSSESSL